MLVVLAGCALPMAANIDAPPVFDNSHPYNLSAGDTVKINIYGEDSLSGDYLIDQHGLIVIPMIGEVAAAGWSEKDLQQKLSDEFGSRGFLRDPLLTVNASEVRPFSIIGEVRNPGSYSYRPMETVFQAIAMAGGYTPRAAENKILIDRWIEGKIVRMNATQNTPVLPGDAITIRERIF